MRKKPVTEYLCDCGDPAVTKSGGAPVCARCKAMSGVNHTSDAKRCGSDEIGYGEYNSTKSQMEWDKYWIQNKQPIAGVGESLRVLDAMLAQVAA